MKRPKTIATILICHCWLAVLQADAQSSVLSEGNWYKLSVKQDGVYKISYDQLKNMGIDPSKTDPKKIKVFGNGGGMLPQANSVARINDLAENAIYVQGEGDGQFNKEDYILFYAEGPDRVDFDVQQDIFFYERNIYADKNFYFLTIGSTDGKRISTNSSDNAQQPIVNIFDDYVYHEVDSYNALESGREWLGENFQIDPDQSFKLDFSSVASNTTIKVVSDVMAHSKNNTTFNIFLNDASIGSQIVPLIVDTQYGIKGLHQRDTLASSSSSANNGSTSQTIRYQFQSTAGGQGYLDFFLVSYKRNLALYNKQTLFRSSASLANTASAFEVSNLSSACQIWEITNPLEPTLQPYQLSGDKGTFSTSTTTLREFIVFNADIPAPDFESKIATQNLHGLSTPDVIIVTYADFRDEALRLAAYRQSVTGWDVAVATTEEVYNEFCSGRQDVSAIRDFVKYLYDKNPDKLKSLILFGRGSYDYKNRLPDNTNFVPIYESRNSLDPLATYASNDFYAFLEDNEGNWGENPPEDHTLDVGVGRLPVKSVEEAHDMVDKIIAYESNKKTYGSWRKQIVLVADDGDSNTHQSQSDQLGKMVETSHPEFNVRRIFLDAFPQTVLPSGEISPETNNAIQDALDRGSVIINYTGHGGERQWAQEKIFDNIMVDALDNQDWPLFVTATCEFGRNDDPAIISSAELCVLKKNAGAIGMVTTSRPVSSNTNFELNQAFYDALFTRESNGWLPVGEIVKRTKNNSTSGVSNRNFSLLGDPSMTLAFPEYTMAVNEITNEEGADSVKALSTITVRGEVRDGSGVKADNFNGDVDAVLFDKLLSFTTLGNENAPYSYKEWHNALFRGKASVKNGDFQFQFVVPKDIAYQTGQGKLSLYASNDQKTVDASGATQNFVVGKTYSYAAADNTPPVITLFMGDTTFHNGGIVSPDTWLVAKLNDDSGINISGYGIGNDILAIMDNDQTFVLNDYYVAAKDDFTAGTIIFRMKGLGSGRHSITLKAWDVYNNPAEAQVDFVVTDGSNIEIETFQNYPNPFTDNTTLFFTHNRAGDDLDGSVSIYNIQGENLKNFDFSVTSSNYRVEIGAFGQDANGKKLAPGLYLARLVVRSTSNGSKNERVTKLIVLN